MTINFLKKIICFIKGHDVYRLNYKNRWYTTLNRKGGKRKGAGVVTHKTKHSIFICTRCGKILKRK